jgi:hypothetical protein
VSFKLTLLMITISDNTASLWLQALAGTGTVINQWLADYGFDSTRVNSRTPGREDNRERYGWGQTTPREMAELLAMIRQGWAVSPAASEEMYRHLTRSYYTAEALSVLPPWVQVASKVGAVNQSRSEVVLVNAPSGDYVFCVITKNQKTRAGTRPTRAGCSSGTSRRCSGTTSSRSTPGNRRRERRSSSRRRPLAPLGDLPPGCSRQWRPVPPRLLTLQQLLLIRIPVDHRLRNSPPVGVATSSTARGAACGGNW